MPRGYFTGRPRNTPGVERVIVLHSDRARPPLHCEIKQLHIGL